MFLKNSLLISHPRLRAALSLSKGAGLSLLAFAVLVACGDEVTEVTEVNESGMKIIEKGEKLPSCTTDNEGALVYALDSAAAYACVNREWTSFKGKDGADGKDGRDGKDGEDGAKGEKGDQGESGKKGDTGEIGTSCTMKSLPDSSGFKVICGGDSVGVVLNGEKGEQGNKGEDGTGCSVEDTGDGFALVTCGEGENASTTKIFKGMCGETPYNPATQFCDFRDSTIYRFVTIDTQTWMAENLNFGTDGSLCYNDSAKYCAKYGRYYTWADAMDSAAVFSDNAKGCGEGTTCTIKTPARGICPEGWHMPDSTEWTTLLRTGTDRYAYMAKGFDEWPDASNDYGFSALPAGGFYGASGFSYGNLAVFWCATEGDNLSACNLTISLTYMDVNHRVSVGYPKSNGYSVRCIKD